MEVVATNFGCQEQFWAKLRIATVRAITRQCDSCGANPEKG
jgi:hypothetical protein